MTESNLNLSQGSDDMPLSAPNIEQALDILTAEAANLSDTQNQKTALANVNLLRDLIAQTRVAPMSMPAPMRNTQQNSNADRAINVATRVQDLGFVEFTAGLINGTFDAIIGATIKQIKAYSELVADIAKTLTQFQAENISDAQVNAHLSNRYPDGKGGTSVRSDYSFTATAADLANGVEAKTAINNMLAVVDALVAETNGFPETPVDQRLDRTKLSPVPSTGPGPFSFTPAQIGLIRTAIGQTLASNMLDHLRAMAREGMARIVITDGSIRTKLTFNVTSTEEQKTQKDRYNRQSFGANLRGRAGWGWGRVSAGTSYSNLSVNTVNESTLDSLTMSTEIIGEVNLKFRTETFPAATI
jgi:hypothetical protein